MTTPHTPRPNRRTGRHADPVVLARARARAAHPANRPPADGGTVPPPDAPPVEGTTDA